MLQVVVSLIRPTDLAGRIGGGLRRLIEVASRIHNLGVEYTIVESEPFLKTFPYFDGVDAVAVRHNILGIHVPWEWCLNRRVIGPILFWLKLVVVSLLEARIVKSSQAQLVLAPGETFPEVLTVWISSRITGRQGAVIVQSDPFLVLGRYRVRDLRSFCGIQDDISASNCIR